jgi:integrase
MPQSRPQGQVLERDEPRGTVFALRFMAGGKRRYQTLGTAEQGWTRGRADVELQNVLADVRRGIWQPPQPKAKPISDHDRDPSFHVFSSEWFDAHKDEWREATRLDYEWQLSKHLLPFFRDHQLSQITIAEIDRYRTKKLAEASANRKATAEGKAVFDEYVDSRGCKHRRPRRPLSVTSINKTITRLAQILEAAVEYGLIERNTAKGKRRRLKAVKPAPVWLDSAEHIQALLDAAGELDREARADQQVPRRALLATLVFSGLRIGELIELRWRDVNLADGAITVRSSKTDAGMRRIDLLPVLQDELATLKARSQAGAQGFVFPTQRGGTMNDSNVRNRILTKAVERANKRLEAKGSAPLPEGLTPHKLRHTYCSVLVALGTDPGAIMDQIGHTDPGFTLRVYRHAMRRDQASKDQLRALVGADIEAREDVSGTNSGTNGQNSTVGETIDGKGHTAKSAN